MSSRPDWLKKAKERKSNKKTKEERPSFLAVESTIEAYRQSQDERPSDEGLSLSKAPESLQVEEPVSPAIGMGEEVAISLDQSPENLGSIQPQVKKTSGQINPSQEKEPTSVALEASADLGSKEPQVNLTLGQNDLRSEKPQVEKTLAPVPDPASVKPAKEIQPPRVKETSGQIDPRLLQYQGSDRGTYTSLPDEMNEALFDLNKREQTVMRFLLRYSLNFKRCFVEASAGFIADGTGLKDTSNVRKAMKALVERGMIVLEREGNSAGLQPPIWRVPWVESYLISQGLDPQANAPARLTRYSNRNLGSNQPQVEKTSGLNNPSLGSNQPEPRVEMTVASGQIDPQELQSESQCESTKNPLPPLPHALKSHLESCQGKHREAEENALASLLGPRGKGVDEVLRAFEKTKKRTIHGEAIAFPLKFMATNDSAFYGISVKVSSESAQPAEENHPPIDFDSLKEEFFQLPEVERERFMGPLRKFSLDEENTLRGALLAFKEEKDFSTSAKV